MRRSLLLVLISVAACSGPPAVERLPVLDSPDSGAHPFDAGAPVADAGSPSVDAGSVDAGPQADAGVAESPDAGPDADAGAPDAGSPQDAGPTPDAGPAFDAGVADAGPVVPFRIEGFGAATRGGWQPGGDEVCVTSLADSGPGSLREALDTATGPRVVRFCVDGTIGLINSLLVPSNVTIDGTGHAITLHGKGLILAGTDDVILRQFAVEDVGPNSEDGLRLGDPTGGPSERVVVDHVRFEAHGSLGESTQVDEAVSVIFGSRDITLQWVRVVNWEKFILIGNGDAPAAVDSALTVSIHHTWTHATGRRHPQARYGVTDVWNCFFDDWRMYDWLWNAPYPESFGVQAQDGARIRFERSLVKRTPHAYDFQSQADDASRCETGGRVDSLDDVVTADSTSTLRFGVGCTAPTGWTRPYPVTLDAADAALRTRLETLTGNVP